MLIASRQLKCVVRAQAAAQRPRVVCCFQQLKQKATMIILTGLLNDVDLGNWF